MIYDTSFSNIFLLCLDQKICAAITTCWIAIKMHRTVVHEKSSSTSKCSRVSPMVTVALNGHISSIIMNPANIKVTNRAINNVRKHTISILPWQHKRYYCIDNYTPMFYVAFRVILHIFGSCMSEMAQQKILLADTCLYSNLAKNLLW